MTTMLTALQNATNVARTTNGARVYRTTNSDVFNLYGVIGSARNMETNQLITLFSKALAEDRLLAMKVLFYGYDARGGQGERATFARIWKWLIANKPELVVKNARLIPEFGRWDMLYVMFGTSLESLAVKLIRDQLAEDMNTEYPSLLGKWLKSENASSLETRRLATATRKALGVTPRTYRKTLSALRAKINVVERLMSAGKWDEIDFEKLPSKASLIYREAFARHGLVRYSEYIEKVASGEANMNTGTLYPYELLRTIPQSHVRFGNHMNAVYDGTNMRDKATINAAWNALPDYFGGQSDNSLVMVDTSASMRGLPAEIALSLGIYAAEHNKGAFNGYFMSFSQRPDLIKLQGETFVEKVLNMSRTGWDMNTNIEAALDLILTTAINQNIPADEMIDRIFIISDMQFDRTVNGGSDKMLFDNIRDRYAAAGYEMPQLVFWQVNATQTNFPMTFNEAGVQLVSGASPTIFKNLMNGSLKTAYEMMLDVLNADRYSTVTV